MPKKSGSVRETPGFYRVLSALHDSEDSEESACGGPQCVRGAEAAERPAVPPDLCSYGVKPFATVSLRNGRLRLKRLQPELGRITEAIYVFVMGGEVVHIGWCRGQLQRRIMLITKSINAAIDGGKSSTFHTDADKWKELLQKCSEGLVYARQGSMVSTSVGTFRVPAEEAWHLIAHYRPSLSAASDGSPKG